MKIIPNRYFLVAFSIFMVGLWGCSKDWLNEKSDISMAVPTTLPELQALLDNLSIFAPSPYIGEIASDDHYVTDLAYNARAKGLQTDAYIWSKTVAQTANTQNWAAQYTMVLYANIVLERLEENVGILEKQPDYGSVRGQALYQRARVFFDLAQLYCLPYSPGNLDKPYGIVLKKKSEILAPSTRSTVKETYDAILADLLAAKDIMPNLPPVQTRPSRQAALSLLAKTYLIMGDYEKAYNASDEALKINSKLLNYNDIAASASFIGRLNAEVIFNAGANDAFISSSCLIDRSFYDLFHNSDLRKTRFFRVASNGTISFKGNYESTPVTLFSGIGMDEIYLIRAESLARLGRVPEAMADLNALIKTRWDKAVPYPNIVAGNQDEAIRKILLERRKELILRNVRWSDLRRLNLEEKYQTTLKRTVAGKEYVLSPGSDRYTFPIPDDIIAETKIAQNPGWE